MKPDIIVTWPKSMDYPLWRQFIRDNRYRFNDIFIGFMETYDGYDFRQFVQEAMQADNVKFYNAPLPSLVVQEDWRNLSVNSGLIQSQAEWVWFTEQDFMPLNGFWDTVDHFYKNGFDAIVTYDGMGRLHPCSIFAKRVVIEKTHKNFSIVVDKHDHFYIFQRDLEDGGFKLGSIPSEMYYHMQGLTSNYHLGARGQEPNYKLDEFVEWLRQCLTVNVPISPVFVITANAVINKYGANKPETPLPHPPTPPPGEWGFDTLNTHVEGWGT